MILLLTKLCLSGWLFFLACGQDFTLQLEGFGKEGRCPRPICFADLRKLPDSIRLESLSIFRYNIAQPPSKSVMIQVSDYRRSFEDQIVLGHFTPEMAGIKMYVCMPAVLSCELRYLSNTGEIIVSESFLQVGQDLSKNFSRWILSSSHATTEHELCDIMDEFEKESMGKPGGDIHVVEPIPILKSPDDACYPYEINSPPRTIVEMADNGRHYVVMCDTVTEGGNWIVFQRHTNGGFDFYRGWEEYKHGFGDLSSDNFWLGNEKVHQLTSSNSSYKLRLDVTLTSGSKHYFEYCNFRLSNESDGYKLNYDKLTYSTAPDRLSFHQNMKFTTFDRDNDLSSYNCAEKTKGGWWYNTCRWFDLNSLWWPGKKIASSEMKMRFQHYRSIYRTPF